jgi:hypothetical protein
MPEMSMDCGAPVRLRDNGDVFSSSAMLGRRLVFAIGLALGDAMLPPPLNGERMGDLAGLRPTLVPYA